MMRLLLMITLLAGFAAAYIAAPFVSAWSIREAVRNGDAAYLERAIDWPSVRVTLKPSLTQLALEDSFDASHPQASDQPPGLWHRIKTYVGQQAVASAVDTAITPAGLTRMFTMRKAYREYVSGDPDDSKLTALERMRRAWARVKRAEFTSLMAFEVDMTDKLDETRLYAAKLELTATGWIMTELRVRRLIDAAALAPRFAGTSFADAPADAAPSSRSRGEFVSRAATAAEPKN